LKSSLYQENLRDLADNVRNAQLLLGSSSPRQLLQSPDQRPSWAPPRQAEIYLRVLDQNARTVVETPGMAKELPPPTKAELSSGISSDGKRIETICQSGKPFLVLIVPVARQNPSDPRYFIQAAMDRVHDKYLLGQYRERMWLVVGLSLVLCSLVGYAIARTGM